MAKHEFGVMQEMPKPSVRYDVYEPHRYNCISVDDDYIEKIAHELKEIDLYWHSVDVPRKGISYCGITLIPPASLEQMIGVIQTLGALLPLKRLLEKAVHEKKWVIHFGL